MTGLHFSSGVGFQTPAMQIFQFDFRSQRKVTPDDAIVVVVENSSATAGMSFIVKFRMLVKLS